MISSILGGGGDTKEEDDVDSAAGQAVEDNARERLSFETRKLRIYESDAVFASIRSGCELRRLREHDEYVKHYEKLLPSTEFAVWRRVNDFKQHMRRFDPMGINLISWPK